MNYYETFCELEPGDLIIFEDQLTGDLGSHLVLDLGRKLGFDHYAWGERRTDSDIPVIKIIWNCTIPPHFEYSIEIFDFSWWFSTCYCKKSNIIIEIVKKRKINHPVQVGALT